MSPVPDLRVNSLAVHVPLTVEMKAALVAEAAEAIDKEMARTLKRQSDRIASLEAQLGLLNVTQRETHREFRLLLEVNRTLVRKLERRARTTASLRGRIRHLERHVRAGTHCSSVPAALPDDGAETRGKS